MSFDTNDQEPSQHSRIHSTVVTANVTGNPVNADR